MQEHSTPSHAQPRAVARARGMGRSLFLSPCDPEAAKASAGVGFAIAEPAVARPLPIRTPSFQVARDLGRALAIMVEVGGLPILMFSVLGWTGGD
eukprot:11853353-Alexandrium_andersonii.AAC.1